MTEDAWKKDIEVRVRVLEQNQAINGERYTTIQSRLDKIDSHINRIVWLLISTIIGGFMAWVISGGLALV